MKGPPGYVPKTAAQEKELQRRTDELIQKRSKVMGALTDSAPRKYQPAGGKVSNLTIDSGRADQHQVMAVTNNAGHMLYWDANGVPDQGDKLHPPRYNTKLCKDCDEYYLDAPQLAAIKNREAPDNVVILKGGKDWGVTSASGKTVVRGRDKLVPYFKSKRGATPCMQPRRYPALNSMSPHAELIGKDDNAGGCKDWSLIFAVALNRFLRESTSANGDVNADAAIAKWSAFQRKIFRLQRVEHNWALQLLRRDILWDASAVDNTIGSMLDFPDNPKQWSNHETRSLSPLEKKDYFLDQGVWPTALAAVYDAPEVIIEPTEDSLAELTGLLREMDIPMPTQPRRSGRRSAAFGFSRFGRKIPPARAYRLHRSGVGFGFSRSGPVVDLDAAYSLQRAQRT